MRVEKHPILGDLPQGSRVQIEVDGEVIEAIEGEPIAAALLAAGKTIFRYTARRNEARGVFCAIGRCTDCMMIVNEIPNVRTCITAVEPGMRIRTQPGLGEVAGVDYARG